MSYPTTATTPPAATTRSCDRERRKRLLCGIASAVLLLPTAAVAQSTPPAGESSVQLDEISVIGERANESPTGPVDGYVAKRTLTGSKTNTPLIEVPQSVSVVTRDQMEVRGVENVGQALTYSAGVVAEPFGTDPRFDAPIIRGFEAKDSQYLNGLKLMREAGMTSIEPYGLERIEVLRGPASILYGQGNPGGMINLVSKRPLWASFGELNIEAGSFDRYAGSFDFSGPVPGSKELAYRFTGLVRDGGAQQDHVRDDRYFFAPAVTWKPSNDTTLTVLANIQHDKSTSPVGLPNEYTVNAASGSRLSRSLYLGEPSFDDSTRTLASIGYEFEHRLSNDWAVRQNARYLSLTWDYQNLYYSSLLDPSTAGRGASYQEENHGTLTVDNHVEGKFATGPLNHTLLVGLDARHYKKDVLTEFGNAPSINLYNPQYGQAVPRSVWWATKVDGTLDQAGLYVQDQIKVGKWIATLGLRHDWAHTDVTTDYPLLGSQAGQKQDDKAYTGRAGLTYLFDNGIAPYVGYSTSFEPVLGNLDTSLGGGAFKPSEGEQVELGVKYQPAGWRGFFTAAVYDLTQTNVKTSTLVGGVNLDTQIGEVKVRGLELSALANLSEGLDLIANYAYTDAQIVGGVDDGNRPANVPEHSASAWLNYTIKSGQFAGLGFGAGVRYVGSRYDVKENTNLLEANTLFDAAVHYETRHYKASINLKNITDEAYVASCGYFGCYYGDGRTVTGRLTYKF